MFHPHDWTQFGLGLLGDLTGKVVLDVGCGLGIHSVAMAQLGATVIAIDVSPVAIRWTNRCSSDFGVKRNVRALVASVYELPLPDRSVDAVFGSRVLHHLDPGAAGNEVARVLKPNGVAVFCENSASNRVVMWGREHLVGKFGIKRYGKDANEYPLRFKDIEKFAKGFQSYDRYFPFFCFFGLLHDFGPLKSGYSDRILRVLDRTLVNLVPAVRPYGFYQIVRFRT